MRKIFFTFILLSFSLHAQVKNEVFFNSLQKVESTYFYVSSYEKHSKMSSNTRENNQILIIDSKLDEVKNIVLPLNENINKVKTDCKSLFKNQNFILVETSFENEKSVKLSSNYSRNLYLIDLVNFSLIKLNNDWSTIIEYELSEENDKLIIIQKRVLKNPESQVIIINFDLKTGDKKEVFKIN